MSGAWGNVVDDVFKKHGIRKTPALMAALRELLDHAAWNVDDFLEAGYTSYRDPKPDDPAYRAGYDDCVTHSREHVGLIIRAIGDGISSYVVSADS